MRNHRTFFAESFQSNLSIRYRVGKIWFLIFQTSTIISIIALSALIYNILNQSFGYIAIEYKVDPQTLTTNNIPLEDLSEEELIQILKDRLSANQFKKLDQEQPFSERSKENLLEIIYEKVAKEKVLKTWSLYDSIFKKDQILKEIVDISPNANLRFRTWFNYQFLISPQSSNPLIAGIYPAILGSLWTILITIIVAFPVGVGAAIYLEEYARDTLFNRIIQTNINNLAGVPSIIYGILGLAIFVRVMEPITSGAIFGFTDPTTANGRTILSASLTLALLILPLIIINSQEAIRAVPNTIREASYSLGATKWQTIWHQILPIALPGILTGSILATSRAMGETAPLVVVGATTFINYNPTSPFSKFTTLPMQIYQWTSRPQYEFRNLAAAAIIVLLILLLSLNATAIIMRNRYSRRIL
jgi:phosphate transport system permease protein